MTWNPIGWRVIRARVPQASVYGPLLILVYTNNLTTLLFFHDRVVLAEDLQYDLSITEWAPQREMTFILDPTKQAEKPCSTKSPLVMIINQYTFEVKRETDYKQFLIFKTHVMIYHIPATTK